MKRWFVAFFCLISFSLQAEVDIPPTPQNNEEAVDNGTSEEVEPVPKSVGKATTDGVNLAKRRMIYQCLLAATVITVGIVALVLVSRHKGHDPHQ